MGERFLDPETDFLTFLCIFPCTWLGKRDLSQTHVSLLVSIYWHLNQNLDKKSPLGHPAVYDLHFNESKNIFEKRKPECPEHPRLIPGIKA